MSQAADQPEMASPCSGDAPGSDLVFSRDGISLYHGDCREVLPSLSGWDVCLTDPPYEAEAHTLGRRFKAETDRNTGSRRVEAAPLDFAPMTPELRAEVAAHIGKGTRRWAAVFCQVEAAMLWRDCLPMTYRRTGIWVKPTCQPQLSGDRPGMGYESIVFAHAPGRSTWNGGGRSGVFSHNPSKGEQGHMTVKPLPLMLELVDLFTDPGELVCDPFAGSGTTLLACWLRHRRAIGVEMSREYCQVAVRRLEKAMGQGRLFPPTKPVQAELAMAPRPGLE